MKEKILEISDKLRNGELNIEEAKQQFLFLFGVSESFTYATTAELMLEFGKTTDEALDIHNEVEKRTIPKPPPFPLNRIMREGSTSICRNCGSTMTRSGFARIVGELLCDNPKCDNSKSNSR